MTIYTWSVLVAAETETIDPFNPDVDELIFDTLSAGDLMLNTADGSTTTFSDGAWVVTVAVAPYSLTTANVSFTDGSMLIIGDNDSIAGNDDAANTIEGGTGNDMLIGAGGADSVVGGDGNDTLVMIGAASDGIYGSDTLDGGTGFDTLFYLDAESGVIVQLAGTAEGGASGGDGVSSLKLFNIEGVVGTDFNDSIVGSNIANHIDGGDGSDTLAGGGNGDSGNDTLLGGDGDDWLRQTLGNDYIDGGAGIDRLIFTSTISGGVVVDLQNGTSDAGSGNIATLANIERVTGTIGNDHITASSNTLVNGLASDVSQSFTPGAGSDTVVGATGDGRTTIVSYTNSAGPVNVNLGSGFAFDDGLGGFVDTFDYSGGANIDGVLGSNSSDTLTGGGIATSISGGRREFFEGMAGSDTIDGQFGGDLVRYDSSTNGVVVNLSMDAISGNFYGAGVVTVQGGQALDGYDSMGGSTDWFFNVEHARGSEFADTLVGGFNDHQFEGLGGDDSIVGGVESFTMAGYTRSTEAVYVNLEDGIGRGLADTANGGTVGVDTLVNISAARGSDFDDHLVGGGVGEGADSGFFEDFDGGAGNDTLDGDGDSTTTGNDAASYVRSPSAIFANLSGVTVNGVLSNTVRDGYGVNGNPEGIDTLININAIEGSSFDDTMVGGDADEFFLGADGNDSIVGGNGTDTVVYENSPNRVIVNLDTVNTLSVGADTVQPNSALDGYGTTDTLSGIENVNGSELNDFMRGGDGANVLEGEEGNDTLLGGHQNTDTAADTMLGQDGDDWIRQSKGADYMDGGEGLNDRLVYNNAAGTNTSTGITYGGATGVYVHLGAGTADYDTSDGLNPVGTVVGIEGVWGTAGDDLLAGGSLGRTGSGGFLEVFRGGAGNDTMDGEGGGFGGASFLDRVEFENINTTVTTGAVIVNLGQAAVIVGSDTVLGGTAMDGLGGIDTLNNIDWVVGTAFADTLVGGNSATGGFERFQGLAGNDYIDGGGGIDEVSYQGSTGPVTVDLGAGTGIAPNGTDTLISIERVRGTSAGDSFFGSHDTDVVELFIGEFGDDTIDGGAGIDFASWQTVNLNSGGINVFIANGGGIVPTLQGTDTLINIEGLVGTNSGDTLAGGLGDQWFRGRGGSDVIDGGEGIDTADYSGDPNGVIVDLGTNSATDGWGGLHGLQGNDSLFNIENVVGSNSADSITGNGLANVLDGGAGNDTLTGGADSDSFVFSAAPTSGNADVVMDFVGGTDRLSLDASELTALTQNGELDAALFVSNASGSATTAGHRILYNNTTGAVYYDADGTGVAVAEQIFTLAGAPSLAASDIDVFNVSTVFLWSDFIGGEIVAFNTSADELHFDDTGISAADIHLGETDDTQITFIVDGKSVVLLANPFALTTTNVTFANDSVLIIGDNTLGITNDNVPNTLAGGNGNDFLVGAGGTDSVAGGDGDDLFLMVEGGDISIYGDDTIDGGNGTDVLVFEDLQFSGVTIDLSLGTGSAADGSVFTLSGIEGIAGTSGDDTLTGDGADNFFIGRAGNDILAGGAGTDTLDYSDSPNRVVVNMFTTSQAIQGADTVNPNSALDGYGTTDVLPTTDKFENVIGTDFNDYIQTASIEANWIDGGDGNDTLSGGGNTEIGVSDTLLGGAGNDVLRQSRGNDYIDGGDGTGDRLEFPTSNGIVYGTGAGQSSVSVNLAAGTSDADANDADTVTGAGGDVATITSIETVFGTAGHDSFVGGDPTKVLTGLGLGGFSEVFRGNGGDDTITGATGNGWNTVADYSGNSSGQAVSVNLGDGTASDGLGGTDTLINVDRVRGGAGNDTLVGGSLERSTTGIFQENFRGNAGNDTIDGNNAGLPELGVNDRVEYSTNNAFAVVVNLGTSDLIGNFYGTGVLTVSGGQALDGFSNLGTSVDTLVDINIVAGSNFNDTLVGGDGNDGLEGGFGNDSLVGGAGSDEARFNNSTAAVIVNLGAGAVIVGADTVLAGTARDGFGTTDTLDSIERVRGSDFDDRFFGGDADERFVAGAGDDTIDGGAGVDYASWSSSIAAVNAFIANGGGTVTDPWGDFDTLLNIEGLEGTNFNDTLVGGDGDQIFRGRGGNDRINGGDGIDTVSYRGDPYGVVVNGSTATDGWGGLLGMQGTDLLISIENVEGSSNDDDISGTSIVNKLDGGAGDDTINGAGGRDSLVGGDGDDNLSGGGGIDSMWGGAGNDTFVVDSTAELLTENPGEGTADWVLSSVTFTLPDNVENLTLTGTANINATGNTLNNLLEGSSGKNRLNGAGGADIMVGGDGNDTYTVDSAGDVVIENPDEGAIDLVQSTVNYALTANVENLTLLGAALQGTGNSIDNVILGTSGSNTLDGGDGNDLLDGSTAADTLIGGDGDDTLIGGGGIDSMIGGLGNDTYDVNSANDKVVEASGGGTDDLIQSSVTLSLALALLAEVEHLTLTGTANNNGTGNALNNRITGNSGNNTIDGGVGADTMDGNDGNDTYLVDSLLDVVLEAGTGGTADHVFSSVSFTLSNVENLTLIGADHINGTGNSSNNVMTGNSGDNVLNGGTGEDIFAGGGGNDTYVVNSIGDAVTEDPGGGTADLVQSSINYTLTAEVENLALTAGLLGTGNTLANMIVGNSGGNTLDGAEGNDTLDGGGGVDTLIGGGGDDSLVGGGGIDNMAGGTGNDTYVVNATTETVTENPGGGLADLVQSSVTFTLSANVEHLTLTGLSNTSGTGNTENNYITGNTGNNTLNGSDGNDTLDGGTGVDVLNGGNHNDVLFYAAGSSVNGGLDTDTLRLLTGALNLGGLAGSTIQNVEAIDLVSGSVNNTLTLTLADVLAISSTTDTLRIEGDGGDTLSATDAGSWQFVSNDGTYDTYTQGAGPIGTLIIDQDIITNLI